MLRLTQRGKFATRARQRLHVGRHRSFEAREEIDPHLRTLVGEARRELREFLRVAQSNDDLFVGRGVRCDTRAIFNRADERQFIRAQIRAH